MVIAIALDSPTLCGAWSSRYARLARSRCPAGSELLRLFYLSLTVFFDSEGNEILSS
jgi:hypothetical protein